MKGTSTLYLLHIPTFIQLLNNSRLLEIYPLADKFGLSPGVKQNGEEKDWMETQMVLFGYNTKEFIHSKVTYIFPYAGVTKF